jgi:hypothetical protein
VRARRIAPASPQDSSRFRNHILSGVHGNFSSIEGCDTAGDLVRPSRFNFRHGDVQGLQKRLGELCPLLAGQLASLLFDLLE